MEEEEANLRIMESLRGRLLAERSASKAAKLDEHLLDSKVKELEIQLKRETKARKRFERKLSSLKSKLESLKLPPLILDYSEESRTEDNNSDSSCISSIASTSSKSPSHQSLQRPTNTNTSSDQASECHSDELQTFQGCPSQELPQMDKESSNSETGSTRSKLELEDENGDTNNSQEEESKVDNSMALVPLSYPDEEPEDSSTKEVVKISNESVREVLGTLQHIREEIQRTMQKRQATRQMIQVG